MATGEEQQVIGALREEFRRQFGDDGGVHIACAPGRVNLIGDHTDYNDGFVLPATIDRAVYVGLRRRPDDRVRIYSANFKTMLEGTTGVSRGGPDGGWQLYVAGVVSEYVKRGCVNSGVEGVVMGDVPLGAGLSSSAALEVSMAMALQSVFGFEQPAKEMALLCRHVEHTYAGVRCGIMDQFSSLLGRSGRALFLDCRTLEYDHVPFERAASGLQLIIVNSNVSRRLSGSKYNERQKECEEAVGYFRRHDEAVKALRDVSAEMLQACGDELPPTLLKRARHVVTENRRVRSALEALWSGDWPVFGALMNASHESLRADYEVTSFELDALADGARKIDGVLGARMTGAGFGGCTVNLVRADGAEEFSRVLAERYRKNTGLEPAVYVIGRNLEARILFAS